MIAYLKLLTSVLVSLLKSRGRLEAEVVLLRHQLNVLKRNRPAAASLHIHGPADLRLALSAVSLTPECGRHHKACNGAAGCIGAGSHGHLAVDRRSRVRHAN